MVATEQAATAPPADNDRYVGIGRPPGAGFAPWDCPRCQGVGQVELVAGQEIDRETLEPMPIYVVTLCRTCGGSGDASWRAALSPVLRCIDCGAPFQVAAGDPAERCRFCAREPGYRADGRPGRPGRNVPGREVRHPGPAGPAHGGRHGQAQVENGEQAAPGGGPARDRRSAAGSGDGADPAQGSLGWLCSWCGAPTGAGRRAAYCSAACNQRAYRAGWRQYRGRPARA